MPPALGNNARMSSTAIADASRCLLLRDIEVGQSERETVTITEELLAGFVALSRDTAPAHTDVAHARSMGFDGCVVHGFLVGLGYSRLLGMFLPGGSTVIHSVDLKMLAPVYVGDTLTYEVKVSRVIEPVKSVQLALSATSEAGQVVNKGSAICVFRTG